MYETKEGFIYCQRRTINSIAALCFLRENNIYKFLIRYQPLPEIAEKQKWDEPYACPITGSIEKNESPIDSAIREIHEEGGIVVDKDSIIDSFSCIATTQMNEKVFCYIVDVTNKKQEKPQNDGTIFESVSFNKWVTEDELKNILKNDITLSSLLICYSLFLKNKD